ncbi:DUF6907 domain-containing protein [Streptomyces sp. KN37]|uniref:DUF6907 domain-containing protein n=1 Tax=Streptomyces sp. KN37 TaxID=3090667 RepID=UPI002A74C04F|nr:hypothetical protein [Streptomyces sp. KN37]WPO74000.1 hypothetical protein R9806_26965 [Streptomyces sp. KN37]
MSTVPQAAQVATNTLGQGSAPRLVAALIGRPGRTQTVFVQCEPWCTEPHASEPEVAVEDITHYSDMAFMQVPTLLSEDTAHSELYCRVTSDPVSSDPRMRAAHVLYGDGSSMDAFLTPDMADELAHDLVAFAAEVRGMARVARAANEADAD